MLKGTISTRNTAVQADTSLGRDAQPHADSEGHQHDCTNYAAFCCRIELGICQEVYGHDERNLTQNLQGDHAAQFGSVSSDATSD